MLNITSRNLDGIIGVLERRATGMVFEIVSEGTQRAESYAQAGGRHRNRPGRYSYLRRSVFVRAHHATAAQKARMSEHVAYHKFLDFFGEW